jgi:hypothetical protein
MISTVEDLLTQVVEAGRQKIDGMKIPHRPTIGDMYEGLTKTVLEKAIFDELDLNVVVGSFIKNSRDELSREMDVMLIEGESEKLPFSERTIVREDQIIAVFQVKKTLNKDLLADAYFNLTNVYDICELENPPAYTSRILLDSYRSIFSQGPHTSKRPITKYFESTTADHIWHSLRAEACLPLRIVLGYQGYASEPGLRDSFIAFLRENQYVQGFSPLHFPNLIISGQFSLLKCNGMPYVSKLSGSSWPFFTSSSNKPILHLLELIWTRLTYRFNLDPRIFGDDLEIEGVNRFISCNIVNVDGRRGWNFSYDEFSKEQYINVEPPQQWEPVKISIDQHHVISYLAKHSYLTLNKINWCLGQIGREVDIQSFVKELVETNLVYIDSFKQLRLLTDNCRCVALPKVGFFAADDKTGKLTRWVEKQIGKKIENILHIRVE